MGASNVVFALLFGQEGTTHGHGGVVDLSVESSPNVALLWTIIIDQRRAASTVDVAVEAKP